MEQCKMVARPHDVCKKCKSIIRANPSERGLFNTQRSHTDGIKTDTVLSDETSEIKRDLCAFGSIGGSGPAPI